LSVGLGIDANFNDALRASLGYGIAIKEISSATQSVESGDGEFYFQLNYSF
jgi:hemolysin activation/secretion protein